MQKEILSITINEPKETTLPDGYYNGMWGGDVIHVIYEKKCYELKTKEGVRSFDNPVVVCVKDGVATFEEIKNKP